MGIGIWNANMITVLDSNGWKKKFKNQHALQVKVATMFALYMTYMAIQWVVVPGRRPHAQMDAVEPENCGLLINLITMGKSS